MKLKLIITGLFINLSLVMVAQEVVFRALATRGENAVQRAGQVDKFEPLKTGMKIYKGDKIVVNSNSYLGLTSVSGQTMEIKEEGIYNVDDLGGNLKADNSSIAQRYVTYIFDDLAKGNDAHNANMSITGSVERSLNNNGINLLLPNSSKVLKNKSTVMWTPEEGKEADEYKIIIYNFFDEEIYSTTSPTTSLDVDFSTLPLQEDESYKMVVVNAADETVKSGEVSLVIPNAADADELIKTTAEIESEIGEESALKHMVMASFYEQNELYVEAVPHFEKAIELEPNVKEFKQVYENFKVRYGIVSH